MRSGQPADCALRDEGGFYRCRFALGPERRGVALAQAFHGGQVSAAAREFGLAHESILDFSSNLNVLAPMVSEAEWEQWAAEIIHYPEPDAETLPIDWRKFTVGKRLHSSDGGLH